MFFDFTELEEVITLERILIGAGSLVISLLLQLVLRWCFKKDKPLVLGDFAQEIIKTIDNVDLWEFEKKPACSLDFANNWTYIISKKDSLPEDLGQINLILYDKEGYECRINNNIQTNYRCFDVMQPHEIKIIKNKIGWLNEQLTKVAIVDLEKSQKQAAQDLTYKLRKFNNA